MDRLAIVAAAFGWLAGIIPVLAAEPPRPNVLCITCEDISPHLGCYGDRYAITPNLDRLAAEGVRYTRCFSTASICTPSRSCIITGVHATSLGSQHLRGPVPLSPDVRCFTEYLRQAGYYCTNNFKEDYNFTAPPGSWDESSKQAHWKNRKPGQPFFAVFNIVTTHAYYVFAPEKEFAAVTKRLTPDERHDPAKAAMPPYYPDTPPVRRELARLYDLITAMDKEAGRLLEQLDEAGLADDTIVCFYSDHGSGIPRHKGAPYDTGLHVPLLMRFPEKYRHLAPGKPGTTADRVVSFVDFAPTFLSLLGMKIPNYLEGQAFLGEKAAAPRQYIFGGRDRSGEGFELIRTVRDARYQYLRNYMPHRPYKPLLAYSDRSPTVHELRRLAAEGKLTPQQQLYTRATKPAEELYDTQNDPYELQNLADSPASEHQQALQRMRGVLRKWMIDSRDTGLLPEAEMHLRSAGQAPYDMTRRNDCFPVERILDAAELVGRGAGSEAKLTALLGDPDSAVRYWAIVGLLAPGVDVKPAAAALLRALSDPAPDVRFAAAEALCRIGHEGEALPVLTAGLQSPDSRISLHAASVLVAIGEKARPALPEMAKVVRGLPKIVGDPNHPSDEWAILIGWCLGHVYKCLHVDQPTPIPGWPENEVEE